MSRLPQLLSVKDIQNQFREEQGLPTEESDQNSQQALQRAISRTQGVIQGGPQTVLNPFVTGPPQELREETAAIEALLGRTAEPGQRQELNRALQVTQSQLGGSTVAPQDLFPEFNQQAEAIARWATRNNRSSRSVNAAMKALQTQQQSRTGLSRQFQERALQAQQQAEALAAFNEQNPDLSSFSFIDPETGRPTVDKVAVDSRLKLNTLQQEKLKQEQELREKQLMRVTESFNRQEEMLLNAFGLSSEPPKISDFESPEQKPLSGKQTEEFKDREGRPPLQGGAGATDAQFRKFSAALKMRSAQMRQFEAARSVLGRREFGQVLSPEELDERFPEIQLSEGEFSRIPFQVRQDLGLSEALQKSVPQVIPAGADPRVFAKQHDLIHAASPRVLARMIKSGIVKSGQTVVIGNKVLTAP